MTKVDRAYLLTAQGAAAIAVVRIVGPNVSGFLHQCFSRKARVGVAVHGDLRDDNRTIDDPIVALLHEEVADLNLHGGPWVVRSVLDLLRREGFKIVENPAVPLPGNMVDPDSSDAIHARNHGIELYRSPAALEQEVLRHLPLARTELGVRMLLAQPAAWQEFWAGNPTPSDVARVLASRVLDRLLHPARVAIVGAANVGKSTLANRLFGQEHSITADLPGTTRDWVGELAELNGVPVVLLDTPGLRETNDPIEAAAIAAARPQIETAEVVVVVLDASRPLDREQLEPMLAHPSAIVAVNKIDRPPSWDRSSISERRLCPIVATDGQGIPELTAAILERLGCVELDPAKPNCLRTHKRAQPHD